MRLDATDLRYITADEFRVLTAAEIGSKNHEVVPTPLIAELSGIRGGQVNKLCGQLAKRNLIARVQHAKYDGYRLTYGGLDYLALRTFVRRKPPSCASVGKKIGVGKESDIYVVKDELGEKRILKLHRLGRISFRAIKSKRDYLGNRSSASWMYMSRLSAEKEFTYMKILYDHGFPVPTPIDQARHSIVMSLIDGEPLRAVMAVPDVGELYGQLMEMIMRFARSGLIHGDFNEFNIMIKRKTFEPIVIDFPQMVSTRHENAEYFFTRDVNCIRKFFRKRFRFEGLSWPVWKDVLDEERALGTEIVAPKKKAGEAESESETESEEESEEEEDEDAEGEDEAEVEAKAEAERSETTPSGEASSSTEPERVRLDLLVEASGFGRKMQRELEDYMTQVADMPASDGDEDDEDEDEDSEDEDEQDDEEEEEEQEEEKEDNTAEAQPEPSTSALTTDLEALRLHKALGNDGAPGEELPVEEEEYYESDSSSSAASDTGTDYTQYIRPARAPRARPSVAAVSKLGAVDELKAIVAGDLQRSHRATAHRSRAVVGKGKGSKWKSSAAHLTGTKGDSGWD